MANTTDRSITAPTNINMVAGGDINLNTDAGTYYGEIKDGNISNFPFPGAAWATRNGNLTFVSGVVTASGNPTAVTGVLDTSNSNSFGTFVRNNNIEFLFDDIGASNGTTSISIDSAHNIQFTMQDNPAVVLSPSGNNQNIITLQNNSTTIGETAELRFAELSTNGNDYVALKAPDALAASVTWTLPNNTGTSGQALVTDGSGNMSWGVPDNIYASDGTLTGDRTIETDGYELIFQDGASAANRITFDGGDFVAGGNGTMTTLTATNRVRIGRVLERQTNATSTVAGTISVFWNSSDVFEFNISGNTNIVFGAVEPNREITMLFVMDAVGGHTVTLPSGIQYDNGNPITINSGANQTTEIRFRTYSSTVIRARLLGQNYA